ncbi:MAG: acetylglutamate kinase [Victivallales bacterium]|jgi:acetylglutamate kinase|nr:acetylglutamate kinase [Victivallales bacterium]
MKEFIGKAAVLIEALPYIQKFRNSIVVVKFGGSAMEDPGLVQSTMRDVVLLEAIGIRPIVVHGGGKAISAELRKRDIPVKFVNGLRYTCAETIKVVDDVLHNQVNAELVKLGNEAGGKMIGLSGKGILHANRTKSIDPVTGVQEDVGFVGEISAVNVAPVMEALEAGLTPVITPLGTGQDGQIYNINADVAACKIAEAIHARKLVFLSDVPGVLSDCNDPTSVIPTIRTDEIADLVQKKILSGGMLPKIKSCVEALNSGINKVHLIDGRVNHTLLLEIFTDHGVGTQIVRPDSVM